MMNYVKTTVGRRHDFKYQKPTVKQDGGKIMVFWLAVFRQDDDPKYTSKIVFNEKLTCA